MDLTQMASAMSRLNPFSGNSTATVAKRLAPLELQTKPSEENARLIMINRWLDTAKFAASLHNSQEWQVATTEAEFAAGSDRFAFRLRLPNEKKYEILAPAFRLHYCSLGCLAENIASLAEIDGYILHEVQEIKNGDESQFVLKFMPTPSRVAQNKARAAVQNILRRHVNRNPYSTKELSSSAKSLIQDYGRQYANQKSQIIEGKNIKIVAKAVARAESKIYDNKAAVAEWLSGFQFLGQARKMQEGLHPSSLAMPLPTRFLLGVLKISSVARLLFRRLLSGIPAMVSRQLMQKSGALILLSAKEHSPMSWFQLGRSLQGLWIELNSQGIALQPVMGGPAMMQSLGDKNWENKFAAKKLEDVRQARQALGGVDLDLSRPSLLLRAGFAKSAQTVSPRKELKLRVE